MDEPIRRATAKDTEGGVNAFSSPTVVHFTLALVVSAIACATWTDYGALRVTLGILGLAALGYSVVIFRPGHDGAWPLFTLAAATLLLVCIGIHNAWDTVTYLTLRAAQKQDTAAAGQ